MVIYRRIEDVKPVKDTVLSIGSYDGLHRGHQEIINRVVTTANTLGCRSIVITFDPHPKQVLNSPGERFELLLHIDKKLKLLEAMNVDTTFIIPFTHEFSRITAREFLDRIVENYFHPRKIIIGYDHKFGYKREGDRDFLGEYSKRGSFDVEVISSVKDKDIVLSSSRIRDLIREGNVRRASFELGWVYGFKTIVIHGSGRGHTLDFPTANFIPENSAQLIPQRGVYFSRGFVEDKCLYGMCNIGYRPTFGEEEFAMEIHFFDENLLYLYGETIEVQFLEKIRDEKKFDTPEELVKQLNQDKEFCFSRLNIYKQEESCR